MDADAVAELLGLEPHPEGGAYRQTWRDEHGTAILFLLRSGERSRWHRIPQPEIWHHYAGDPLLLSTSPDGKTVTEHLLGADLATAARPQVVVPPGHWQAARTLGRWTLTGCTVSPPFTFDTFELAPAQWEPG